MSEAGIASMLSTSSDTAKLRLLAGDGDSAVNSEVLQQFEALFLQQMLKSMRTASLSDGMFQSEQMEFYRDMYDQQIAADLAEKEVLGISQIINRQLGGETISPSVEAPSKEAEIKHISATTEKIDAQPQAAPLNVDRLVQKLSNELKQEKENIVNQVDKVRPLAFKPDSPDQFVKFAYEYSQIPAKQLGVDANVLVAIAALETGWGKHLPEDVNGSSNNYFGIKADNRWQGDHVASPTLEFENGTFNELKQSFRAYDSLKESFNDFAEFISSNERYSYALEFAHDTKRFLQEIQNAGYATDPKYADKILNVLGNKAFTEFK